MEDLHLYKVLYSVHLYTVLLLLLFFFLINKKLDLYFLLRINYSFPQLVSPILKKKKNKTKIYLYYFLFFININFHFFFSFFFFLFFFFFFFEFQCFFIVPNTIFNIYIRKYFFCCIKYAFFKITMKNFLE